MARRRADLQAVGAACVLASYPKGPAALSSTSDVRHRRPLALADRFWHGECSRAAQIILSDLEASDLPLLDMLMSLCLTVLSKSEGEHQSIRAHLQ